ncbi:MAG: hypothetical protein ACR2QL_12135 [Woeseiaceae bacterium]
MRKLKRTIALVALLMTALSLAGCDGNVGVGVSVGVPVGSHGHMRVGASRWY